MTPWLNFSVLIVSSFLFILFYVKSVSPASLAKQIGPPAYQKCTTYRVVSSIFMVIVGVNYILYYWFPLPVPLPRTFSWPWPVSVTIAAFIAAPCLYLMFRGIKDAGEETMRPKREHAMYAGIYTRIRHPQALGEFPLRWVFAFLVDSPFLVLFSFAYVPVWYYLCVAEERDLLVRYGAAYEEYRKKTGFWLPKGGNPDHVN
ncbi:MAG: isoprenylcysteine carboxylmethyltransferase family protein [Candidatus Acidiferrum sp.]